MNDRKEQDMSAAQQLSAIERFRACQGLPGKVEARFPTYIPSVDAIFAQDGREGVPAGLYITAGDPGAGKSTWVLQVLQSMAIAGHMTVFFAFEGKANVGAIVRRMGMHEGVLAKHLPAFMDKSDGIAPTHQSICAFIRELAEANTTGLPLVIGIDSLKHVNGAEGNKGRRAAATALYEMNEELRAKGKGVVMFLIGHIDKASRGKGKANKKLQGIAEAEELVDCAIFFLDRTPAEERNSRQRRITLSIDKNRWGQCGEFDGFLLTERGFKFPPKAKR